MPRRERGPRRGGVLPACLPRARARGRTWRGRLPEGANEACSSAGSFRSENGGRGASAGSRGAPEAAWIQRPWTAQGCLDSAPLERAGPPGSVPLDLARPHRAFDGPAAGGPMGPVPRASAPEQAVDPLLERGVRVDSFISAWPEKGETMNMWAVAGFASIGIRPDAFPSFSRARARPKGEPASSAPLLSAWNSASGRSPSGSGSPRSAR